MYNVLQDTMLYSIWSIVVWMMYTEDTGSEL